MRRLCAGAVFRPGKRRDAELEGPVRGSGLSPALEQAAVSAERGAASARPRAADRSAALLRVVSPARGALCRQLLKARRALLCIVRGRLCAV